MELSFLHSLDTAYLIVKDCREADVQTVTPATTKSVLEKVASAVKETVSSKLNMSTNTIKVQFNPSTLSFQSSAARKNEEKASIDRKENGDVETTLGDDYENQLSVSMTLVFDKSIYTDFSVQSDVERFLALIKNPYIRQVTFCWGKLCYEGVVQKVNAEYVLFDITGIPTRANVMLTLNLM